MLLTLGYEACDTQTLFEISITQFDRRVHLGKFWRQFNLALGARPALQIFDGVLFLDVERAIELGLFL